MQVNSKELRSTGSTCGYYRRMFFSVTRNMPTGFYTISCGAGWHVMADTLEGAKKLYRNEFIRRYLNAV